MISVIVPIFNAEKYLEECIVSLLEQKYTDFELILINDGSTDNSAEICQDWVRQDTRIKYYEKQNSGVSETRNFGLDRANGEFICFVDADDCVSKNYLSDFMDLFEEGVLVCCDVQAFTENIGISDINDSIVIIENMYDSIFYPCQAFMCNRMYEKKIIEKNKLRFDKNIKMCEDLCFNLAYFEYCKKVKYFKKNNYYYRKIQSSASKNLNNKNWFTIYKAMEILMNRYELFSEYGKRKVVYFVNSVLIESKYREKICKNSFKEKRVYLIKELNKKREKMFFKDFIKIFLMKFMPKIFVKYKIMKVK